MNVKTKTLFIKTKALFYVFEPQGESSEFTVQSSQDFRRAERSNSLVIYPVKEMAQGLYDSFGVREFSPHELL